MCLALFHASPALLYTSALSVPFLRAAQVLCASCRGPDYSHPVPSCPFVGELFAGGVRAPIFPRGAGCQDDAAARGGGGARPGTGSPWDSR
eukprot:5553440-Pyramimonas_sp.AAC.1